MNKVKKLMSWNAFPALLLFVIFLGINGVMTGGLSVSFFRSFIFPVQLPQTGFRSLW